jgi:hypothetical protein
MLLRLLGFSLMEQSFAEMALHLRQRELRFAQREIPHMF